VMRLSLRAILVAAELPTRYLSPQISMKLLPRVLALCSYATGPAPG
jgi:hypothetical protein